MSINPKGYSSKSNARRAVKAAGLPEGTYTITGTGPFMVTTVNGAKPETIAVNVAVEKAVAKATTLDKASKQALKNMAAKRKVAKTKAVRKGGSLAGVPMLHQSEILRPCKTVWAIADGMKGKSRAEIIAACVHKGIAFYTARTQYQQYRAAMARSVKK